MRASKPSSLLWLLALLPLGLAASAVAEAETTNPERQEDAIVSEEVETTPASPVPRRSPAFSPGEELVYKVTALGMSAGRARIQVGTWAERDGVRAWPVVVNARTDSIFDSIFSVRDRFVSWWEPSSGRVLGADLFAEERGKRHRSRSRLDHDEGKAEVFRLKEWSGERSTRQYDIPAGAYDIAGAIFALRQREFAPGKVEEIDVFTGSKVFKLRCFVERKESIRVGAGTFDAWVTRIQLGFEGNFASKRDVRAWFSADDRKVPLRMEADLVLGSLVADLTSAKAGIPL